MNDYIHLNLHPLINYIRLSKTITYWYNLEISHSSLGYFSPLEMEVKLRGIIKKIA